MDWFFATMLVLAGFNPLLPKPQDYSTKPRAYIVRAYSRACLQLFRDPRIKQLNLSALLQDLKFPAMGASSDFQSKRINPLLLVELYQKVCRPNPDLTALDPYSADINAAENLYASIVKSLPSIGNLHEIKLPQAIDILSADHKKIGDLHEPQGRRHSIALSQMPPALIKTLVAVEDRRFYKHHGVDQIGILRAIMKGFTGGHLEGASTITQQLARNLFLSDKISYRRKLSEMLLAGEIEKQLTKKQILQLYLNLIYWGRDSWGIEEAAETYFGKPVKDLNSIEIAFLVAIIKGPNLYQYPDARTQDRVQFVLDRMYRAKIIPTRIQVNVRRDLHILPYSVARQSNHAAYFRDYIADNIGQVGVETAIRNGRPLQTTLVDSIQTIAEKALRTGLVNYEKAAGRNGWRGPIVNISPMLEKSRAAYERAHMLQKIAAQKTSQSLWSASAANSAPPKAAKAPTKTNYYWLDLLRATVANYPPALTTWQVGVVLNQPMLHVGLADGSIVSLDRISREWAHPLRYGDLVYVAPMANSNRWKIVQAPQVNGGVLVLNAKTGQVLAMVGGYSHILSSWNRTLAERQPGSLVKPFTYMAALQAGYQPNFLLSDGPFIFPAVAKGGHRWMPHNDDTKNVGERTMRWAFEQSRNTMTADLMSDIGMNPIRALSKEFGVYSHPDVNYPFILGAQSANILSLCQAYAGIDSGFLSQIRSLLAPPGANPDQAGEIIERDPIQGVDPITLFQMRYLMQGVVERGTAAAAMHDLAPYVAGKTGTTEDSRDAWFIGFSPQVVVGVYVGYDEPKPLGYDAYGGTVAAPIAHEIFSQLFQSYGKPQPFPPPPPGVTFLATNELTGQIEPHLGDNIVVEAYRSSEVKESPL